MSIGTTRRALPVSMGSCFAWGSRAFSAMPFSASSFSMRSLLSARSEETRAADQLATGAADPCSTVQNLPGAVEHDNKGSHFRTILLKPLMPICLYQCADRHLTGPQLLQCIMQTASTARKSAREDSCGCMMQLTPIRAALALAAAYLSRNRGARLGGSLRLRCILPEGRTGNQQLATMHWWCLTCMRWCPARNLPGRLTHWPLNMQ